MYLPRRIPSISDTATLTRWPGDFRTAAMTWAGMAEAGMRESPDNGFVIDPRARRRVASEDHSSPMRRSGLRMRASTALVALHVSVALFGFAALFGKWIALSPVGIVFGRTVVAAITLAIVLRWTKHVAGSPNRVLVINGALLALHWVTFFAAIQIATVAIGLLGFASFPVFVLILERALHGRRPTLVERSAVGIVVVGLALIVPEFSWTSRTVQGLAWGVASGFTFALLTLRNRALVPEAGATVLALWQNTFAALWLVPVLALWQNTFAALWLVPVLALT